MVGLGVGDVCGDACGDAEGETEGLGEAEGDGLGEEAKAAMLTKKVEVKESAATAAKERLVFNIEMILVI